MPIETPNDLTTRDAVRALAARLDDAAHGERSDMIASFAQLYGWSKQKVYRELKRVGWSSGRRRRCDAGTTSQDMESLTTMTGLMKQCIRKNGKPTMHTPTARSVLSQNEIEFKVGNARLNQLLKRHQMDLASQRQPRPCYPLRSLHPNHVHLVDPSLCLIYYLPDGGQAVLHDDEIYKNKPENIERLGDLKVWRYVLTDHYSNTILVRYYQSRGETQASLFDFLLYCWGRRADRVFHGVPKILYMDAGSANTAHAIKNAARALDVEILVHEPGNPRSKGSVEVAQNIVETKFECRLKEEPVKNVEELNAAAEAWCIAYNADRVPEYDARLKRPGMREPTSRFGLWQTIRQEQLRILPDPEICRYLLSADPKERKVRADLTVSFKHPGASKTQYYDLAGFPNIFPRAVIKVSPLIYGHLAVIIYTEDYKGDEQSFIVEPIAFDERSGFRLDAAVIGEEMKSQPDTGVERAGKAADQVAYPGKSMKEIKRAKNKNAAPFEGKLDAHSHLAHIDLPAYMQRPGTDLNVPDRIRPELKPMTTTEACKRLIAELGPAPKGVNYFELVEAMYPDGVTDEQFDELLSRMRGNVDELREAGNVKP